MPESNQKPDELSAAIAGLEAQRSLLGDTVVEPALAALRQKLAEIHAPASELAAEEERKIVTILFADVSGFTALSENLDPEEVRNLINACFEQLVPIVKKYEGTVDKFMGDEIMALFGAPVAHENDPERALRAALEMIEAIGVFNREHTTELDIHAGVNTGPVVAGRVGAQDRQDYSVMGDAVNLAARLEGASANGEIYVGPNTYRQTAALFDFEALPPLKLQGKEQPVEIYRLMGLKAAPKPVRGIEGLRAPLVGRDAALQEIHSAIGDVRQGKGSVVAVVGEAGLGKSRLIAEALQDADVAWAEGRALSHTAGMSYWVARDLFRALLGMKSNATPEEIEKALRTNVEQIAPKKHPDLYPYLARMLEVPLHHTMEEQLKFLNSEALQSRILGAFQEYVRARATRQPLILFWEDLHWCDPSSFRVLEMLLTLTREAPLLLLLAYRPDEDFVQKLQRHDRGNRAESYRVIELSPLTQEQSGSLIQGLLKIENLPEKMRALILDRAEGNPFFLEELLRSLLDAGIIVLERGRVLATGAIESASVPATLQGVLMARIDRLAAENKRALQKAAVIGRVFQQKVLARLYDANSSLHKRLNDSLAELRRREFIQSQAQKSFEEDEYIFKHAITHDVAYHSLLMARRRQLHKRVAEAIEALFPRRLDEFSATLGYHFERAESREKAIHYLRRAAERAQATFANTEALAFYRSALKQIELLLASGGNDSLRVAAAQIEESIGDVEQLIGQQDEARAAYKRALCRLPPHDVVWLSRLHRKTAKNWIIEREHEKAAQSYTEAETILQSRASATTEWQQEWLQIQLDRMWLHYWRGQVQEIVALAEHIRSLVEEHATSLQRGNFFQGLTLMALRRDRYTAGEETIANAQTSLAAIEESNVLPEIGHARFVLGFSCLWAGKLDLADKWICDALKLTERTGDIVLRSRCLTYLTVICRRRGEVEDAQNYAEQSLSSAMTARMPEYIGMAKGNLAWVHMRNGDLSSAYQDACEGVEKLRGTPQGHILLWVALWPLIGVEMARGKSADAVEHAETLLIPPQMAIPTDLETAVRSAVNAWKENDPVTADHHLKKGADLAKKIGYL
jgi:class 3 adenylate cyclase/tetratricopeptide (TPR) repeat protein